MFKINIYAVGEIKEQSFKDIINEYLKRLSKFAEVKIIETKEEKIQGFSEEKVKFNEANNVLKKLKPTDFLILLDLHGKELDSIEFSKYIENLKKKGISPINICIAGTLGFHESLIKRANFRISISKMTFTHQFCRVIILEQLYRAFKIINNESYHH